MSGYVDTVLVSGEAVLYRGRPPLWAPFWVILVGILLAVVVIGLFMLIGVWIHYTSTEFAVTSKRIIAKFGFLRRRTIEINLPKVESLQVEQGIWGRMLDYGTVIVHGTGSSIEPIVNVKSPLAFRNAFVQA